MLSRVFLPYRRWNSLVLGSCIPVPAPRTPPPSVIVGPTSQKSASPGGSRPVPWFVLLFRAKPRSRILQLPLSLSPSHLLSSTSPRFPLSIRNDLRQLPLSSHRWKRRRRNRLRSQLRGTEKRPVAKKTGQPSNPVVLQFFSLQSSYCLDRMETDRYQDRRRLQAESAHRTVPPAPVADF